MTKFLKKVRSLVFADDSDAVSLLKFRPKGILKIQPNYRYSYLEGDELQNFVLATKEYYERVSRQLYKKDPQTGRPL